MSRRLRGVRRARAGIVGAAAAAVLAAALLSAFGRSENRGSTGPLVGFNDNAVRMGQLSPARDAALTRRSGARLTRVAIDWRSVEGQPGHYGFLQYDEIYQAARHQGIKPLFAVTYAPSWATDAPTACGGGCLAPPAKARNAAWRRMVATVASRYPEAAGIEIWNEPNLSGFFQPRADARRYVDLLRQAYRAIKRVNPRMTVLGGAVADTKDSTAGNLSLGAFVRAIYENGAKGWMDGLSFHLYPDKPVGEANVRAALRGIEAIRDRFGDQHTPLWVTEAGLSTTKGFDDEQQRRGIVAIYRAARATRSVKAVIFHTLIEAGPAWNPDAGEIGFGLLRRNGLRPKPAYCALVRELGAPQRCR